MCLLWCVLVRRASRPPYEYGQLTVWGRLAILQGALVHQDHRYEGQWKDDLPDGPGCYVFGDSLVQEGVYTVRQQPTDDEEPPRSADDDETPATLVPVWRAGRSERDGVRLKG